MKKKPIIYIMMEIKARELEGRTHLALEAASRGFRVVLGPKNQILMGLYSGNFPNGICYEKSLSRGKESIFSRLINQKHLIACQDEETGLTLNKYDYNKFLQIRSTIESVNMASAIFCYGMFDYNFWSELHTNSADVIHLTGSPRIDFWRPDFKNYYRDNIHSISRRFNKFVLVSSNFVFSNGYMSIDDLIKQGRRNGSILTKIDELSVINMVHDTEKMFKCFVSLINFLSYKHSDINFVVRPHPAEKISFWDNAIAKRNNISVIFEGGISGWLRASSAVIHNGCTTGMEAYVSEIPAIAYVPFTSPINIEIPNRLSINCTKQDEVSYVLHKIINKEPMEEYRTIENDKLIRNRVVNIDGDTAAKRIVDVLENLDVTCTNSIKPGFEGWKIGMKNKLVSLSNTILGNETKSMRKFPFLNLQEIKDIQNQLIYVNEKCKYCDIKRLFGDVFLIEKKH